MTAISTWVLVLFLANGQIGRQERAFSDCQLLAAAITAGVPQFVDMPDGRRILITHAQCLPEDEAMRRYFGGASI